MFQVQIYLSDVDEWFGWGHGQNEFKNKPDADKQAAYVSRKFFWKTRVVKV